MQGDAQHNHCDMCGHCDHCCRTHGSMFGHNRAMHWLIKIIVLLVVFWVGARFGELSAQARFGYMMGGYGAYDGGYGPGMMFGGGASTAAQDSGNVIYYRMGGTATTSVAAPTR